MACKCHYVNYTTADLSMTPTSPQTECLLRIKAVSLLNPNVRVVPKLALQLTPARLTSRPRRMRAKTARPAASPATQHILSSRQRRTRLQRRRNDALVDGCIRELGCYSKLSIA